MQEAMNARAIEELYVDDYMFVSFPNKFMCKKNPDEWISTHKAYYQVFEELTPILKDLDITHLSMSVL